MCGAGLMLAIARLYDFHPSGNEDLLIDTMKMLKYTGDPWEDVFKEEVRTHYTPSLSEHLRLTNAAPVLPDGRR